MFARFRIICKKAATCPAKLSALTTTMTDRAPTGVPLAPWWYTVFLAGYIILSLSRLPYGKAIPTAAYQQDLSIIYMLYALAQVTTLGLAWIGVLLAHARMRQLIDGHPTLGQHFGRELSVGLFSDSVEHCGVRGACPLGGPFSECQTGTLHIPLVRTHADRPGTSYKRMADGLAACSQAGRVPLPLPRPAPHRNH